MRLHDIQVNENMASRDRNHGVEHEVNNFEIRIDGQPWKILPGKGPDDSPEQVREENRIAGMCQRKTAESGKVWSWRSTSQEPNDTITPSASTAVTTNFQVFINGRSWRVFKGAGPDNSLAQRSEMDRLEKMCNRKSVQTGRKWEVKPTKAEPTPAGPRPHITEKQINMPARFSPGDEVRVKGHPELYGVLVKLLADNAALVDFEIDDGHEPVGSEVDLADLEPATVHESKMSRLDAELDNPEIDDDIHDPNISDEEFEDKYGMSKEIAKMFRDAAINDKPIFDPKHDRWTEYGDPIHEQDVEENTGNQIGGAFGAMGAGFSDAKLAKAIVYFMQGRHQEGEQFISIALSKADPAVKGKILSQLKSLPKLKPGVDPNDDPAAQKYINDTVIPWIKKQLGQRVSEKLDANQRRAGQAGPMEEGTGNSADPKWHGSNADMEWYDAYKDQPIRVKVKNHSGIGDGISGTFLVIKFEKIDATKATLTIKSRDGEMTATVNLDKPETVLTKQYDRVPAMKFYIGSMPATARQAFNLFQHKNNKSEDVSEGDVFFIEMGNTLIETTVLRANHDTVLLAADNATMAMLDASSIMEAEYHGHKVQLGKPMQGDVKKFKVYVKDPKTGNIKKVNFGDPNMRIKKSNPARRRSFRARHHCETPGPRTKARYWSCRKW